MSRLAVGVACVLAALSLVGCGLRSQRSSSGKSAESSASTQATQPTRQATRQVSQPPPITTKKERPVDKQPAAEDEPTYRGIPKSKYVKALKDKDREITDQAVKALAAMGKDAEEDLYAAFAAYQSPAALSISIHWYLRGKDGVPWFVRALKENKNVESAAQAAANLVFMHQERHDCLPRGSELRRQAEAALRAGEASTDTHIRNNSKATLPQLLRLP